MKIALIIAYFGKWPIWFPAFLESCKYNSGVDWILFTDCEIPNFTVNNVKFVQFTVEDFNSLASNKLGFQVNLPFIYKMCDFKPTFGLVFEDYLKNYDFWGHCDLDVVWGNIRKFITDDILNHHEIISGGKEIISGHFCLYKNTNKINNIFTKLSYYKSQLTSSEHTCFDESAMTNIIKNLSNKGEVTVYWPKWLVNFPNLEKPMPAARLGVHINRWYWEAGKLYNRSHEVMYIHFMTWKKSLTSCKFDYSDNPTSFYISYSHIGLNKADRPSLTSQLSSLFVLIQTLIYFDYKVWYRRINHYVIKKILYRFNEI